MSIAYSNSYHNIPPRDKISIQLLTYTAYRQADRLKCPSIRRPPRTPRSRASRTCGSTKFLPLWGSPSSKTRFDVKQRLGVFKTFKQRIECMGRILLDIVLSSIHVCAMAFRLC